MPDGEIQPKVFKALLTMDAYVLLSGGSEEVRTIQRWFNGRYLDKSTYFISPCDGHYSRDVQKALVKALQYEIGVPPDDATGNFGPATQAALRNHLIREGDSGVFVQLFSAACVFNGTIANTSTSFKSTFDGKLTEWVRVFQKFSALEVNGRGDYQTWAAVRDCGQITNVMRAHLSGDGPSKRFSRFFANRHGGNQQNVFDAARNMLTGRVGDDTELSFLRLAAIKSQSGVFAMDPESLPEDKLKPFVEGYAELIRTLASP